MALVLAGAAPAAAQDVTAGGTPAQPSQAQASVTQSFDIAAQPLGTALVRFSEATGIQLFLDASVARGVQSPGVRGTMSRQEALIQLLAGSGLVYRFTNANTVTVEKPGGAGAGQGAIQLDPLQVQGFPVPPQAQIDNLPAPYAGGQIARGGRIGILGNEDFMNSPFSDTAYTSELIKNQQARTISDAMKNDPSVRSDLPAGGGIDNFKIRGFTAGNQDILFNGLAGIAPTFATAMAVEPIERIEVLRGPAAMLNGAAPGGSIGGTINVVPKRAESKQLIQFTPSYISNGQVGGHIDMGFRFGPDDSVGVRFNGLYRNGSTPIDRQAQETKALTAAVDYRGDHVRAAVDFGYQSQLVQGQRRNLFLAANAVLPDVPINTTNYNSPWNFERSEIFYGAARAEVDVIDNVTVYFSAGANNRKYQIIGENRPVLTGGVLPADVARLEAEVMNSLTVDTGVRGMFETGPISHKAVAGNTVLFRNSKDRQNTSPIPASNIYNPVFGPAPLALQIPNTSEARKRSELTFSSFALGDTLSILDDRLQLTLGARMQRIASDTFNRTNSQLQSTYDMQAITPAVGILGKPLQNVSLYANYIEGLQQGPTAPAGTVNSGEVFAPFISRQYEVGVKADFGKITASLAAFQITQPNAFVNPATNIFGVDGEQRNRGLELTTAGVVTEGVRILGGLAYTEAILTKTAGGLNQGNQAPGVPLFTLNLGGEWDLPFVKGLTLSGLGVYTSQQYLNNANTQIVPSWTRFDVGARYVFEYAPNKPVALRFSVENVLDTSNWSTSFLNATAPSMPRTFLVSLTGTF